MPFFSIFYLRCENEQRDLKIRSLEIPHCEDCNVFLKNYYLYQSQHGQSLVANKVNVNRKKTKQNKEHDWQHAGDAEQEPRVQRRTAS